MTGAIVHKIAVHVQYLGEFAANLQRNGPLATRVVIKQAIRAVLEWI
jgi:hypothetical protein